MSGRQRGLVVIMRSCFTSIREVGIAGNGGDVFWIWADGDGDEGKGRLTFSLRTLSSFPFASNNGHHPANQIYMPGIGHGRISPSLLRGTNAGPNKKA
jgi:hypothetical protein